MGKEYEQGMHMQLDKHLVKWSTSQKPNNWELKLQVCDTFLSYQFSKAIYWNVNVPADESVVKWVLSCIAGGRKKN